LLARDADYLQGSRWMRGGRVVGPAGGRGFGTRVYSLAFSILAMRRVSDATNGFRILKASILKDPAIDLHQSWLTSYDLEPYVLYKAIRLGYRVVEHPVTVRYHGDGYTKMQGVRDWWRLFRPALLLRTGLKHRPNDPPEARPGLRIVRSRSAVAPARVLARWRSGQTGSRTSPAD